MLHRLQKAEPIDVLDMLFAEKRKIEGRPWVMLNMVESVDGATAVGGGASAMNDEDDRGLFLALRSVADIVLNGAETVRAENLGPVRMDEAMATRRRAAELEDQPTMAILTRSLNIDPTHRAFSDQTRRPRVITGVDADARRVAALSAVADVVQVDELNGHGIVGALSDAAVVLCEGGPTVNSQLIAAGLVDEINLTLAPMLALGESKRIAFGSPLEPPAEMRLDRILQGDRSLFLRYVRA